MSSQITVPAASRSVITATPRTTFQVGTYTALTDTFTKTLDLNDHVNYWLVSADLAQPKKVYSRSTTIRAAGERIANWNYQNRHITLTLQLLYEAGTQQLLAAVRSLLAAIENPPYRLAFAAPNSTVLTYADVVAVSHTIPYDGKQILAQTLSKISIDFECAPGFSGDRVTLQNLVVNPGFEAPSGAGVTVFDDSFATINAYAGSGGTLTQDVATYSDAVFADSPLRYYRLDESAGPTVYDASSSAQNGTANPVINFLQASALAGSSDGSANFPASGYISLPTTGLPTGNAAFSLEGWFKSTAVTTQTIVGMGGNAARTGGFLYLNTSGQLVGDLFSATLTSPAAYNNGAWHHAVFTWDGTNGRLYADGALVAGPTALGTNNLSYGAATIGAQYTTTYINLFNGSLDEIAIYSAALSSTRVSAHYNAGHVAPAAAANTLQVPAGATVTFGSTSWGAVQQWQMRFRFRAGMTAMFNAHGSGNNNMGVEIGANTLYLQQTVAGSQHILASAGFTTINESWYWFTFTQFPTAPGTPCNVTVILSSDANGNLGSTLATITATPTYDGVTALSGQAQFTTSGAALGIGGAYVTRSTHSVTLFGPGGWSFTGLNGSTGLVAGAWDQNTANTYSGGAVTSFGAFRMDLPHAGTVSAYAETYSGGAPAGSTAIAATTGQDVAAAVYVRSTGLSGTAALALAVREWDASGNLLRATTLSSVSGNHPTWTQLSGSVILGASTAYVSVQLLVSDATAGASAGGVVWWDNVQCWNVTTTGQSVMPYCELRFRQSPAQLLLTGLQGDMPAPAYVAWGTYLSAWNTGSSLSYALGRRTLASANAQMVGGSHGYYGTGVSPQSTAALDSTSYGGYYTTATINPSWNPRAFSFAPADAIGVYHLFNRFWTAQSAGNLSNVEVRVLTQQKTSAWYGSTTNADQLGAYYGPFVYPLSASSTWTPCDVGQVNIPALPAGALSDLTQNFLTPRPNWGDLNTGGSVCRSNWQMLLPVDGGVLVGTILNPSNAPFNVTSEWLWSYLDGLLLNQANIINGETPDEGATYSLESAPTPNPGHAGGGPGTSGTGAININNVADAYMTVDPNVSTANASGVNQFAGYIADNSGAVLPFYAEFAYTPLYLYPRQS